MIDYFALALTHALILIALIRVVGSKELDEEPELDPHSRRRSEAGRHTPEGKGPGGA